MTYIMYKVDIIHDDERIRIEVLGVRDFDEVFTELTKGYQLFAYASTEEKELDLVEELKQEILSKYAEYGF